MLAGEKIGTEAETVTVDFGPSKIIVRGKRKKWRV